MSVVKLHQVTKSFSSLQVLKDLNLTLEEGEVLGLFGHNGAGKTTCMKLILGLLPPSSGEVEVFGQHPAQANFNHNRYNLGFLPENVSFYQQLTGLEVLTFFARLKKVPKQRCLDLLSQVGLQEAMKRKVKTYSKGMKQRLGLAQALLTEPKLLLLDEPTIGLDPLATQDFYVMVDELKQKGCSVILCSHVLPGVEKHIDRAAILSKGQLQALGSLPDLRQQAQLPMKIRIQGNMNREFLMAQLKDKAQNFKQLNFQQLEFTASPSNKMPLLKQLLAIGSIEDIDIKLPSLEQLYRHFMETVPLVNRGEFSPVSEINQNVQGEQQA